ncbi:MAG: glycosyltransferase family 4 protein [Candidatus Yanofskybacteria bacterium]|nr:glycosyltransferase family 4 protein [Candidatus Yanofskybacteria bacterium]
MLGKTKKILVLSTSYLPMIGGSEVAIKEATSRLPGFQFDLIAALNPATSPREEKIGNVNVFRAGSGLSLYNFLLPKNFLPIAMFLKARELIKKRGPYDLIHVFQASQAAGAAWLLKWLYPKLPVLLTLQEGQDLKRQNFLKKFFRRLIIGKIDSATAISSYLKNYVLELRKNLPVEVIPNGVDSVKFSGEFSYGELSELADRLGILPDEKVIVSTSRLVPKNGLDILIKTFATLVSNDKEIRYKLLLIGDGGQRQELIGLAGELGVADKVVFVKHVSQDELPKYLKISHVFVRPSRSEGLGISFLEAMAAGLPIVGTAVGGITDFLVHNQTGLICDGSKPEDVAEKIKTLIADNELRKRVIKNSQDLVREKYDWNKIALEYARIYNNIGTVSQ